MRLDNLCDFAGALGEGKASGDAPALPDSDVALLADLKTRTWSAVAVDTGLGEFPPPSVRRFASA